MFSTVKRNFKNFIQIAGVSFCLGSSFTYKKYAFMNSEVKTKDETKNFGKLSELSDQIKPNTNSNCSSANLPVYTRRQVMEHCTPDKGMWVIFRNEVYDITEFAKVHPGGGEKLMMVAGGVLDPFWEMYSFHKKDEIYEIIAKFKIGVLDPKDKIDLTALPNFDSLKHENISRSPYLTKLLDFPYCAECPPDKLINEFYTPNEYFFIRNHNIVPEINIDKYKLEIRDQLSGKKRKLKLDELKRKYKSKQEEAIIMCTGNRRKQMNKPQAPKGLSWNVGAVANGVWEGVPLREVLSELGYNKENSRGLHLIANGCDKDFQGTPYSVSIPLDVAFSVDHEVLIAYSYNGSDIPYEHGYPLRLIIPGYVGVRNVKWLKSLEISTEESQGTFQQRDYKIIPQDQEWEKVDLTKLPALMKHVLNSVIVTPADGDTLNKSEHTNDKKLIFRGWAIGNYGSPIVKVQLSFDQGATWKDVDHFVCNRNENNKAYGWTLWDYSLNTDNLLNGEHEVWVRAEDEEGNHQPLNCEGIWNLRGLMNNAIHKVRFNLI